jgi:L-ascorbate metabolism protein UlaG (beta-lactamase superfamily)
MKTALWLLGIIVVLVAGFYALNAFIYNEKQADPMTSIPVEITPIEHATGILAWAGTTIYFDPTGGAEAFAGQPTPDLILLTDIHGDHLSTSTLEAIVGEAAIVAPPAVAQMLPQALAARTTVLSNGESVTLRGFTITGVPMYNLPSAENANFHTPGRGNGYLIEQGGTRVYLAGDTAGTPEMRALQDIDLAFVPMNLPYTMSVDEAAEAVLAFAPKRVYPYHYRGPDGLADVARFKTLVDAAGKDIEVMLLEWYPQ